MTVPAKKKLSSRLKRWAIDDVTVLFRHGVELAFASAVASAVAAWLNSASPTNIVIVAAAAALAAGLVVGVFAWWRALKKWEKLTAATDLVSFEERNDHSPYMPEPLLERESITKLWVMGNGCGKWVKNTTPRIAREKLRDVRRQGGQIRFMVSCPLELMKNFRGESGVEATRHRNKARLNAESLSRLRQLQRDTQLSTGSFEIKTYKHIATLRLIILNDADCIVGHYQENGVGDSLETPLLIFRRSDGKGKEWGFGHAFHRLFDHEWKRAGELLDPNDKDYWQKIDELRHEPEEEVRHGQ